MQHEEVNALHPIFDNTSPQQDSSNTKRYFFSFDEGRRVVSVTGSKLMRWCMTPWKSFRSLVLESVPEKCNGVTSSVSGNYLCIYTDDEINIIEVPWGYSDDVSSVQYMFHLYNHKFEIGRKIKQVLFHPMAFRDSCVVVLFEDDTIAMVNFSKSTDEGGIVELNRHDSSFGLESRVTKIVTMQFSNDGLSLFLLSTAEGGDIYTLYPCLPGSLNLGYKEVRKLFNKSMFLYKGINEHTPSDVKRNTIKMLQFLEQLKRQMKDNGTENSPVEVAEEFQYVKAQGPFSISPYPEELYESTATDLKVMPLPNHQSLLLMSFSNGSVLALFQDLELIMSWDVANFTNNNSLTLVEHIKPVSGSVKTMEDLPGSPGKFICHGTQHLNMIDTTCWSTGFSSIIAHSDMNKLLDLRIKSSVEVLKIPTTVTSCILWSDNNHAANYYFVGSNSVYKLVSAEKETNTRSEDKKKTSSGLENGVVDGMGPDGYEFAFSKPLSEIRALENSYHKRLQALAVIDIPYKIRNEKLDNETNENQLEQLTDISEEYARAIALGQNVGYNYRTRIIEDIAEFQKQIRIINQLRERCKELDQRKVVQEKRYQDAKTRNQKLAARMAAFGQKAQQVYNSSLQCNFEITKAEDEWFKEIKKYAITFNQNVKKTKATEEELRYIKNQTSRRQGQRDKRDEDEWAHLQALLKDDLRLMSSCSNEMKNLTAGVNTLGI